MKYLITGGTGQLGYDIKKTLLENNVSEKNIICLNSTVMNILDKEKVLEIIEKYKPNVVFHCAAWTNVDKAEENIELCTEVNVNGTQNILEGAVKVGAKVFYISTDYVFDGTKKGLYEITDIPNPQNVYGKSKYEGEKIISEYDKYFIVRISWVFGINGNNFVKTMLKLSETKKELSVVCDQIGSPTYTVDLAKLLYDMSKTDKYGLYHATNEGFTSWADFARYIFKINKIDMKINDITTSEYMQKTKRPLNSMLSKDSLDLNGFERLPSWQSAVERFSEEIKKEKTLILK